MKKLFFILAVSIFPTLIYSQSWVKSFYSPADSKTASNFYEIQKEFSDYWKDYDLKGGYYYVNGEKRKAVGWKQFKRWEWYWETRIDRETGNFPSVNTFEKHQSFFKNIKSGNDESNWIQMGPSSSEGGYAGVGRINCVGFHPTNPDIFFVGAPSGGLWKTTNGGQTWEVLTDTLPVIGVSEIIIPNDYDTSKTLFIATGDRDAGDNNSIGVLKTTDDGKTWEQTGLSFNVSQNYRITRLLIHPTDQNILYASTNGGIYKSIDGAVTWSKITESGVFFDLEFKHNSESTVLFALKGSYSNSSKILKTSDAGLTWTEVFSFPSSVYRVELDVAKSDPSIVYALASTQGGGMDGIYKSTNSGDTFLKIYDGTISGNNLLNWSANSSDSGGQGWYDLTLSVSPTNANILYLGGINSWKSTNGGTTWSIVNHWYGANGTPAVHADKHYMEFQNGSTFFEANDGGIYKTNNGGSYWIDLTDGMVISQMYKLGVSQTIKDEVITGLQDNGSKLITTGTWYDVKGGDGMECIIDYENANIQYATYVNGQIDRTMDKWSTYYNTVDISANIPGGANGAWVTPYLIDPVDNKTLYVGYADVWKTTNRGNSWIKISNLNLSNKIRSMAIAESDINTLYITDLNNFYRTTNGGTSWDNLTGYLPSGNSITSIAVDNLYPQKVWITLGGYNSQKAYESNDGGQTWTNISGGLPGVPANTIIQNKASNIQHLYAGTDIGVFFKNGDNDWTLFSKNLPSVIVTELEIHYDKIASEESVLYASTYGRGLWKSNLSTFTEPEISIVDILGPYFVSNDSSAKLDIAYELTESFSDNTFTAYLSDETGDFSNPIEIGALESIEEGIIEAIIPEGTPSGKNYRVKVISSNPVFESQVSNSFEIVLDNVPPTVLISSVESNNTSVENFDVNITFNKLMNEFEQTDILVNNAQVNTFNDENAPVYTINVSPIQTGNVSVEVPSGVAYDMLGNWNAASNQWSIYYTITSIESLTEMGIKIFPNPTDGQFSVSVEKEYANLGITIIDFTGRALFNKSFTKAANHKIDLSHLPKSIYIVKLNVDGEDLMFRLVIE
ncbi:MAG: T9SS type A sorting domain-containing protein [Bacteroidales bacterium]|jgi:photosystem II stability/assembly factor-like uncharacterized protein|nr:T9SS type A sorting domain-containing protein [Bacteroidales bacterium]MDY0196768.1 T9SS type A sorting domain-containing protein [Tenuifilaceae bacterium]